MANLAQTASVFIAEHRALGAALVGLVAFGESMMVVGAFLPATVLLIAAGGLIAAGLLDGPSVLLWATVGAVAGDSLSFAIGRTLGPRLLRGRLLKPHARAIARTRLLIRRFGGLTIFIGRFAGPLRALVPVMAGMAGMPQRRFQLVNFASGIVWVAAFVGPGYAGARGMALLSHLSWQALALSAAAFLLAATAAFNRRRIVGAVRLGLPSIRASAAILGGAPQLAAR
ncbi:DedA family protein [Caulobacter sp. UC70_42]|uniref:DedA family protein n=1 Tax=Caulobacter sp. UC70_42 TaxID=3374551 RepID=UPI0037565CC0